MSNFVSESFYYRLTGDYALFTDPVTKGGGEKFSYQVPTFQALKGITEQIYWKPSIVINIEEVKVINAIQMQTNGIRTLNRKNSSRNDLNYYTYLKDVEYLVKFNFKWNEQRDDLVSDRNIMKHTEIIKRSIKKGGRRDIFLGTRECLGYVEELEESDYYNEKTYYSERNMSFGIMFHSFAYPSETRGSADYDELRSYFTHTTMKDGVIEFKDQEDCEVVNHLGEYVYRKVE